MPKGIFSLNEAYAEQTSNTWSSGVWVSSDVILTRESPYGYYGGGRDVSPSYVSAVDRIDYTNDGVTALIRGPLERGRFYTGAIGSRSHAYVVAGNTGGGDADAETTVSRIDYSNDTNIAAPKGPLTRKSWRPGTAGNSDYGYIAGGATNPGTAS